MFSNLIESGSHRRDFARRGRFFLGTLAFYGGLLAATGVASVYAYNARLEEQTYTVTLLPPHLIPVAEAAPEPEPPASAPRPGRTNEITERSQAVLGLDSVTSNPPPVSTSASNVRPIPRGLPYHLTGRDIDVTGGPAGPPSNLPVGGGALARPAVRVPPTEVEDVPPPTPAPAPTPRREPLPVSSGVLVSKTLSKPAPPYPAIARAARVEGSVAVQILVDEQGRVVSATPTSGPVMLRQAAQNAAMQARFTPTLLSGQPVKVSGVITYNFNLQ